MLWVHLACHQPRREGDAFVEINSKGASTIGAKGVEKILKEAPAGPLELLVLRPPTDAKGELLTSLPVLTLMLRKESPNAPLPFQVHLPADGYPCPVDSVTTAAAERGLLVGDQVLLVNTVATLNPASITAAFAAADVGDVDVRIQRPRGRV